MDNEYKLISSIETSDNLGVRIYIKSQRDVTDAEDKLCSEFVRQMAGSIEYFNESTSPEAIQGMKDERNKILSLFQSVIYVREIPNEYWPKNYGLHYYPWFIVTTSIGHIKMGCRKRVIVIDWTDTDVKLSADELFPGEEVTKINKSIHAWGYDKAREYIDRLLIS